MGLQATLPHKERHATGGSDPLTPADIAALACLQFTHGSQSSFTAGSVLYMGQPADLAPASSAATRSFIFPFSARIHAVSVQITCGTSAINEALGAQINLYDATNNALVANLISGQLLYSNSNTVGRYIFEEPISVGTNEIYSIQLVAPPSYGTGPATIRRHVHLYFSRFEPSNS